MTLKSLIASDVQAVFLNKDEFAEDVEYHPKGGTLRTVTVTVLDDSERFDDEQMHIVRTRVLRFFVEKHETRGIISPQLGDYIIRDDDQCRKWDFEQINDSDSAGMELTFRGDMIEQTGRVTRLA